MDTVVANKYSSILGELNIEVSKKVEGEFEAEEIISTFQNYFFNKMFLDITAIKNYKDLTNLQKVSMGLNMDKVILLLDKEDPISDSQNFLSKLVGMGIYNFTKEKNNLMYLYTNPNLYRDVAYLQNVSSVEEVIPQESQTIQEPQLGKKILGFKNLTDSAGSTSLIYMIKKELSKEHSVLAIELDKKDFIYYKDSKMISVKKSELENTINDHNDVEIFLVDLNNSSKEYICNDVLYLIEPSTPKINKLMAINYRILPTLKNEKVVLNKSLLSEQDIIDFEKELKIKIYYNIPPLNDKKDNNKELMSLLQKLGYIKIATEEETEDKKRKGLFTLFKLK